MWWVVCALHVCTVLKYARRIDHNFWFLSDITNKKIINKKLKT